MKRFGARCVRIDDKLTMALWPIYLFPLAVGSAAVGCIEGSGSDWWTMRLPSTRLNRDLHGGQKALLQDCGMSMLGSWDSSTQNIPGPEYWCDWIGSVWCELWSKQTKGCPTSSGPCHRLSINTVWMVFALSSLVSLRIVCNFFCTILRNGRYSAHHEICLTGRVDDLTYLHILHWVWP